MPTADVLEAADVEAILDTVRPALRLDGGNVKLLAINGVDIHLEMLGSCRTCSSLPMTMKYGIEVTLLNRLGSRVKVQWKEVGRLKESDETSVPVILRELPDNSGQGP